MDTINKENEIVPAVWAARKNPQMELEAAIEMAEAYSRKVAELLAKRADIDAALEKLGQSNAPPEPAKRGRTPGVKNGQGKRSKLKAERIAGEEL